MRVVYVLLLVLAVGCRCKSKPERFPSQFGQDRFVYEHFFQGKTDGVFVDIGAYDGVSLSNTYFFEKELGWTGVCIEPQPKPFARLKRLRNCITIRGCIAAQAGKQDFLMLSGAPAMLSGLVNEYDSRHLERVHRELKEDKRNGAIKTVSVNCYRLVDILKEYDFDHIDFLSLDTEGGELSILQSIDFDQIPVNVITVENNYHDVMLPQFLEERGFDLVAELGCDQLFVSRRFLAQQAMG